MCTGFKGAEVDLKKHLTSITKHLKRETFSTIGFTFAFLLQLQPDSKLAAASKRDVTSVFIDLVLSQIGEVDKAVSEKTATTSKK